MSEIYGRWDLTVTTPTGNYPSWVELREGGGSFVGIWGSARPVPSVEVKGDEVTWQLPKQYEGRQDDMRFHGRLVDGQLVGSTTLDDGSPTTWVGKRAPSLERPGAPRDGETIELVGGDLSNWELRGNGDNQWAIVDGVLVNAKHGTDLMSAARFDDFRLTAEYRYPEGSNSGIYLRGRYEYQILDDHGSDPHVGGSGAIYGFLAPSKNTIHPFGEWNTAVITLIGRQVQVELNGEVVVKGEIPGITGDAIESDEGAPGPIMLQGTHGPVEFRKLSVTRLV